MSDRTIPDEAENAGADALVDGFEDVPDIQVRAHLLAGIVLEAAAPFLTAEPREPSAEAIRAALEQYDLGPDGYQPHYSDIEVTQVVFQMLRAAYAAEPRPAAADTVNVAVCSKCSETDGPQRTTCLRCGGQMQVLAAEARPGAADTPSPNPERSSPEPGSVGLHLTDEEVEALELWACPPFPTTDDEVLDSAKAKLRAYLKTRD